MVITSLPLRIISSLGILQKKSRNLLAAFCVLLLSFPSTVCNRNRPLLITSQTTFLSNVVAGSSLQRK